MSLSHKHLRPELFVLVAAIFPINIWFCDLSAAESDLCYFDSKQMGNLGGCAKNMDVEITELKREAQTSFIRVRVRTRGTVAGSAMFQMCSFANIAKDRRSRYFVILDERQLTDCTDCEWSQEYTVGFLRSTSGLSSDIFKEAYPNARKSRIEDINKSSMVCGFLPIPSSEFHQAVYFGELDEVRKLAQNKKHLFNEQDENGYPPLHLATVEGHSGMVEFLVFSGADINGQASNGWAPLHLAIKSNRLDMVKLLLNLKANPAVRAEGGNTPLHTAAYRGCVEFAVLLIDGGSSVDATDNVGNTPLHAAASRGHVEMVKYLLAKDAVASQKNRAGQTPLFFAEAQKHLAVIEVLANREPK